MTPRRDTLAAGPASSLAVGPGGTRESTSPDVADLAALVVDLQARGLRVEVPLERRQGGAGPSDSGMLWVGGIPLTVPTDNATAADSPYVLKAEDDGYAIYRDGRRLAGASDPAAPTLLRPDAPPTGSRTGRSPCCTWTRSPAPSCRPARTGATTTSASSAASASRSTPDARSSRRPRSSSPRWPVPPRSSTAPSTRP